MAPIQGSGEDHRCLADARAGWKPEEERSARLHPSCGSAEHGRALGVRLQCVLPEVPAEGAGDAAGRATSVAGQHTVSGLTDPEGRGRREGWELPANVGLPKLSMKKKWRPEGLGSRSPLGGTSSARGGLSCPDRYDDAYRSYCHGGHGRAREESADRLSCVRTTAC